MRLDGRRQSSNFEDRRGKRTGMKIAGGGIGALIIAALIAWVSGGNPLDVISSQGGQLMTGGAPQKEYVSTPEDEELALFSRQILAGTEDVWTEIFRENGLEYKPPKLVLYDGAVQSACGGADASVGPFYCSADQSVYIDLSFFRNMRRDLGADGDFAYAYVIAHEVGHHVQHLLGTLDNAHSRMARLDKAGANKESVRLELQADFYAGVWAHNDNKRFRSLEPGDIEEALDAASKIGDDYLQKKARGYAVPESFNHGTSAQRGRWLRKGLSTGRVSDGDTFALDYTVL